MECFFFNFLFYIGVQSINNVVTVSCSQQSDSTTHIHVSFLPQTPLPSSLTRNIEQSSLCYTAGPCCIHFKYSSVHMSVLWGAFETVSTVLSTVQSPVSLNPQSNHIS